MVSSKASGFDITYSSCLMEKYLQVISYFKYLSIAKKNLTQGASLSFCITKFYKSFLMTFFRNN